MIHPRFNILLFGFWEGLIAQAAETVITTYSDDRCRNSLGPVSTHLVAVNVSVIRIIFLLRLLRNASSRDADTNRRFQGTLKMS